MIDPSVMRLHALHKDLQFGIGAEWSTLPDALGSLHLRATIGLGMGEGLRLFAYARIGTWKPPSRRRR